MFKKEISIPLVMMIVTGIFAFSGLDLNCLKVSSMLLLITFGTCLGIIFKEVKKSYSKQ